MSRPRKSLYIVLFVVLLALALAKFRSAVDEMTPHMEQRAWPTMSTFASFATAAKGADADREQAIAAEAFREVERDFSVFNPTSALSRLNAEALVPGPAAAPAAFPSNAPLAIVVRHALRTAEESGGAFDPTVTPLLELWGFPRGSTNAPVVTAPAQEALDAALAHVGHRHLRLAETNGAVLLSSDVPGLRLDLGAIAKGFAVDLAYDRLRAAGSTNFLLCLGGNVRVSGRPAPRRAEWNIAVQDPFDPKVQRPLGAPLLDGDAVATSGSYQRFVVLDGVRHSHILDPRTGRPVRGLASVSVVAPTAMEADAASTALFVLGRPASTNYLALHPGYKAEFIDEPAP